MKISEKEFTEIVRENKTTIYTVCYMFSADREEVEDLFQEVLVALWHTQKKRKNANCILPP